MNKPKALIVDDSVTALRIEGAMLERLGFEVSQSQSGEEAMSMLMAGGQSFHLIVLDHQMCDMSGVDFGKVLKQSPMHRETPLVMLSGACDDQLVESCRELGFAGCFHKENNQGEAFTRCVKGIHTRYLNTARPNALVVDDSPTALSLLSSLVEVLGFDVKSANSGLEAMHILSQEQINFKLLVVDYDMEVMTGIELGRWIRGRRAYDGVPMYLVSAVGDENLEKEASQVGFQGCFHKDSKLYRHFTQQLDQVYKGIFSESQQPATESQMQTDAA